MSVASRVLFNCTSLVQHLAMRSIIICLFLCSLIEIDESKKFLVKAVKDRKYVVDTREGAMTASLARVECLEDWEWALRLGEARLDTSGKDIFLKIRDFICLNPSI